MKRDTLLFEYDRKGYTYEDIVKAFGALGIQKGDRLFIHSELGSFGKINPHLKKEEYLDAFLEALKETVGPEGTLIMPTFTYSFCEGKEFDRENTPSTVGILTERFRTMGDALRTSDPIFSAAIWGADAASYQDVGTDCFGKGSIFQKIQDRHFKILCIGNTFDITYIHAVEQEYHVPYRYMKRFMGKRVINGDRKEYSCDYYVRMLDNDIDYDLEKIANFLEQKDLVKKTVFGYSHMRLIDVQEMHAALHKGLSEDVHMLLKTKGNEMFNLVKRLFPICRSLTGEGTRETLRIIQEHIPIVLHEVHTGTKVFDWTVPKEWNIKDAYVMDETGKKVIDFKESNLHVVGYSIPVNVTISLSELNEHLYSLPEQPDAIPYVTSYYKERWGFCMRHTDREKLREGRYMVVIDSELREGSLTYGELIIPGKSKKEIFLSTYVCHPSMANNELSGPAVTTFLAQWILSQPRNYTYRIIFIPETIGSLTYLSENIGKLKKNVIAGFNISCVGDDREYGYLPTKHGGTLADRAALHVLSHKHPDFKRWSFLDKGSDERQYNAPGVDLPVCCILRSKYGTYPEYHTSLDNLDFVTHQGLEGAYDALKSCLKLIEENKKYKIRCIGEPQLGKRGLYPTTSTKSSAAEVRSMMNFIAYADGETDLIDICTKISVPAWEIYPIIERLLKADLLAITD